jgi:hypothetical protein
MAAVRNVAIRVPSTPMSEVRAIEEKLASQRELAYLAERAARGRKEDFVRALAKAGTEPRQASDEVPEGWLSMS